MPNNRGSRLVTRGLLQVTSDERRATRGGFVLAEIVVVICLIGLFVSLAMINVTSILGRNTFKSQANGLVSSLRMAAAKAAESSRRYEIIIDFPTQSYTFREITSIRPCRRRPAGRDRSPA